MAESVTKKPSSRPTIYLAECAAGLAVWVGLYAVLPRLAASVTYGLAGIAVGAGIHGYVPENFMASIMGKAAW